MNVFALDPDPVQAAQDLADKHVVQMGREAIEALSAAHRVLDGTRVQRPHGRTGKLVCDWQLPDARDTAVLHVTPGFAANHHCLWARHCSGNYLWLAEHALAIFVEYTHRYGRTHVYEPLARSMLRWPPLNLPVGRRTAFCQGVAPDCYRPPWEAVLAHRLNYVRYKSIWAQWRRGRSAPAWYTELVAQEPPRHRGLPKRILRAEWGDAVLLRPRFLLEAA